MIGNLEEVMADMEHGVYDLTKNGKCTGCGNCCSNFLPLSDAEVMQIRRHIRKHDIRECKHNIPTAPLAEPMTDWTCPFLDDDREKDKCTIYSVRPLICRVFRCDLPKKHLVEEKARYWKNRRAVDMRETFFGR